MKLRQTVGTLTARSSLTFTLTGIPWGEDASTDVGALTPADVMGLTGLSADTGTPGTLTTTQLTNASLTGFRTIDTDFGTLTFTSDPYVSLTGSISQLLL